MLELQEWHRWYEASIVARAEYHALAADRDANADLLDAARERLERAEATRARIMARLERFEAC
jgi:predicted Zn-dependent protease